MVTVVEALEHDLAAVKKVAPDLAGSALAATARQMALLLDDPDNSATSKSMCARVLCDVLDQLRELMPDTDGKDDLDELNARRAARRAGGAAA